jgi:hypothetical protein
LETVLKKISHRFILLLLILCAGLATPRAVAQSLSWTATTDSGTIRMGEQTIIRLMLKSDGKQNGKKCVWPHLSDSIMKGILIVRVSKIDTLHPDSSQKTTGLTLIQRITITSFDSGYYAIPPFPLIVDGDTAKPLLTEAMMLRVQGMRVDTTLAIKDIKQPLKEPFDWHELIPWAKWIAIGLAGLAALIFLIRYLTKKKPNLQKQKAPAVPAHITALENLEKLKEKKLWQNGKLKLYHSELTDIIRLYIEQRFKINALEQTSDEIMRSFRSVALNAESKEKLAQLLLLADLVKFAKQDAMPDENEMSLGNAIAFVQETKPNQTLADTEPAKQS